MTLQKMTAGFHFAHTYAPTVITMPACDSCSYFDTNSTEFKEALRQAKLRFETKHPGLIEKMRDKDKRGDEIEEILHCAAEEEGAAADPKNFRVCRRCGTAARRKHARFCWECGGPLSPDASDPTIINPILTTVNMANADLTPLQFFDETNLDDALPPQARELLANVIRAVRQVHGNQTTFLDVYRFLTDQSFRDTTIGELDKMGDWLPPRYLRDAFNPNLGGKSSV